MSSVLPLDRPPRRSAWRIQRAVILALFIRELRSRVQGRWLGMLWLLFEPLAHVTLILTVFGFLRHTTATTVEFPVFLVTGILPFFIFRTVTLRLTDAIGANRGLFTFRQVKPIDTLVARAMVEVGLYSMVYGASLLVLGWLGYRCLPWAPLELMGVSAVLVGLAASLGLLFAVLAFDRPKVRSLVGLAFLPLYISSGVIFAVHVAPPHIRELLLWNPVLHLIELSRTYFIPNYRPLDGVNVGYPFAITLIAGAVGLSLYRVNRLRLVASS